MIVKVLLILGLFCLVRPGSAAVPSDVEMIEKTPQAEQLCGSVFANENFEWLGIGLYRNERVSLSLPTSLPRQSWSSLSLSRDYKVEKAVLDFTNTGKKQTVYRIAHWATLGCCVDAMKFYLVVDKSDEKFFRSVFEGAEEDRDIDFTEELLAIEKGVRKRKDVRNLTAIKPYGRKSFLYALSATAMRDDNYEVGPELFLSQGRTYILSRADLTLLRPNAEGTFTLVCRHKEIHSHAQETVKSLSAEFPCPAGAGKMPASYKGGALDLVEWGGRRPVEVGCDSVDRINCHSWVAIGAIGAESVSRKDPPAWEPFVRAVSEADDPVQTDLHLTEAGPYLSVSTGDYDDDFVTTYYRIARDGLTPACSVEREVVPPEGYRDGTGGQ